MKWLVKIKSTEKEYKLKTWSFEHKYVEIYSDESIRKQYGYDDVIVYVDGKEYDLKGRWPMLEMEKEYSDIKSVLEPLFTIKEIKW